MVVVNYNAGSLLAKCVQAALPQVSEILVVDNASSDSSIEACARQFADEPRLRILHNETNLGFATACNIGFKGGTGEFVLFPNPDCRLDWGCFGQVGIDRALINPNAFAEPRWLEALLVAAKSNPEFDVFGSKLVNAVDPTLLDGAGDAYHMSGLVWRMGHGMPVSAAMESAREVFSPCAAAALYRRSALRELGGFDEDYFCYVEDVDLGFRLRLAGHRCLYVPQSVAHHVGSGTTGGQHSDFALYHGHRNLVCTFVKNMPGFLFWLLLPLHVSLNLVSIIWFALRGRGGVIWRAKRDAVLGLPKMWHKRQHIQKTRVASIGEVWRQLDKRTITTKFGRREI